MLLWCMTVEWVSQVGWANVAEAACKEIKWKNLRDTQV